MERGSDLSTFRFRLAELMHPLMRQPEEAGGIARAHLQLSCSEYADRTSGGAGGASVLFVGLPAPGRVGPNRLRRRARQLHVVHNRGLARIVDEQFQRLPDATPSLIDSATLRVAAAYSPHGGHPPARLVSLVGNPRTSRLLQPSLSEARLQVALDTAQQAGPDVLTRMNRYSRHTPAAFDAQMRVTLTALEAKRRIRSVARLEFLKEPRTDDPGPIVTRSMG